MSSESNNDNKNIKPSNNSADDFIYLLFLGIIIFVVSFIIDEFCNYSFKTPITTKIAECGNWLMGISIIIGTYYALKEFAFNERLKNTIKVNQILYTIHKSITYNIAFSIKDWDKLLLVSREYRSLLYSSNDLLIQKQDLIEIYELFENFAIHIGTISDVRETLIPIIEKIISNKLSNDMFWKFTNDADEYILSLTDLKDIRSSLCTNIKTYLREDKLLGNGLYYELEGEIKKFSQLIVHSLIKKKTSKRFSIIIEKSFCIIELLIYFDFGGLRYLKQQTEFYLGNDNRIYVRTEKENIPLHQSMYYRMYLKEYISLKKISAPFLFLRDAGMKTIDYPKLEDTPSNEKESEAETESA